MTATPYSICTCVACGPPWRRDTPEPDKAESFGAWLGWHSWMALCPTCGNKRCPAAANHDNACSGSNDPGQPGSNYPAIDPNAPKVSIEELLARLEALSGEVKP